MTNHSDHDNTAWQLVKFHQQTNVLDESQTRVIEGALRFDDKTVRDVMTPLDKVRTAG